MRQSKSEPRTERSVVYGRASVSTAVLRTRLRGFRLAPKRKEMCPDYVAREVLGEIDIRLPADER
jgi:hypothetical protein